MANYMHAPSNMYMRNFELLFKKLYPDVKLYYEIKFAVNQHKKYDFYFFLNGHHHVVEMDEAQHFQRGRSAKSREETDFRSTVECPFNLLRLHFKENWEKALATFIDLVAMTDDDSRVVYLCGPYISMIEKFGERIFRAVGDSYAQAWAYDVDLIVETGEKKFIQVNSDPGETD